MMRDHAIEAQDLTRWYGGRCVVDALDLSIPAGSLVGFLGRNGAGKSTTIRMLLGLVAPTRGISRVLGHDSRTLTPSVRSRIGYVAESHPVVPWMTVAEFGRYQADGQPRWRQDVFTGVLSHFDLLPSTQAKHLSRGERAGLSLACVLAADPELLILDDPTLGLDPVARHHLLEALIYLTRRSGRTILLSSHSIADVERIADRLLILDRGRLKAWCTVDDFRAKVRCWRLAYAGDPPAAPMLPGLLRIRRDPGSLEVTLVNQTPDAAAIAALARANSAREIPLTLEEAFIAYVGERREARRFLDGGAA
jgi:ABC-2 type transport system ATP-binding protein